MTVITMSLVAVGVSRVRLAYGMVRIKQRTHVPHVIRSLAFLTLFLPGLAGAHGNATMEEDTCVQRVGGSLVHFNAYQPQNEAKAQYCTEIPGEGDTFLVVDLVDTFEVYVAHVNAALGIDVESNLRRLVLVVEFRHGLDLGVRISLFAESE